MSSTTYDSLPSNYAVPPGATLAEWLDEHGMSQGNLAQRIGRSTKMINQVINGVAPILASTALDLETVTGIPARLWLALEANYQEDRARLAAANHSEADLAWLNEIPVAELRKRGYISAKARDKSACLMDALRFFGTATVDTWRAVYLGRQAVFRQSEAHEVSPGAVAAWLRIGELEAERLDLPTFRRDQLRQRLAELRQLTRSADDIGDAIVRICKEAGLAVVFIPDITGTRSSGATHWVGNRPILQLSLRGKTDDRFWFTFFHEIGHLLLHDRGEVFIERRQGKLPDDVKKKEREADSFAADLLIPAAFAPRLPALNSLDAVRAFAAEVGVSPGVVVGRLHNDGLRLWSWGAGLKSRIDFVESETDD